MQSRSLYPLALLLIFLITLGSVPTFLPVVTGAERLAGRKAPADVAPSVPVHLSLTVSSAPALNEVVQLQASVTSDTDADNLVIEISLPNGISRIDGNLSWTGNFTAGATRSLSLTIQAIATGNWTVRAKAGYPVAGGWYGDQAEITFSVQEHAGLIAQARHLMQPLPAVPVSQAEVPSGQLYHFEGNATPTPPGAYSPSSGPGGLSVQNPNQNPTHDVPIGTQVSQTANSTSVQSTPRFQNGTWNRNYAVPGAPLNHWWLIDYWNAWNYYGSFTAVANSITGLSSGDDVLILPLNLAYGSSTNLEWFQFDIDFNGGANGWPNNIWWGIWNVDAPSGCSVNIPNSNYHPHTIGLTYTIGHSYHYQSSIVNGNFRFQIWDDSAGTNWYMDFGVPSTSQVYDSSCFSPASALEGYTTPSSVGNVPYYQFTIGYGMTSYSFGQYGSGLPNGLRMDQQNLGGTSSAWHWEMTGGTGYTVTFKTNPTAWAGSPGCFTVDGSGPCYTDGQTASLTGGGHTVSVYVPSGYQLVWVAGNRNPPQSDPTGVYVPNITANPASLDVNGNGWLKAVFAAVITFHTNTGTGSINYGSQAYTDGQTRTEANLLPDYGNTVTVTANPPSGNPFISWSTSGMLTVDSTSSQTTTLHVNGPGTLTANFQTGQVLVTGAFYNYISEDAIPAAGAQRADQLQPMVWGYVEIRDGNGNFLGGEVTGPDSDDSEGRFRISITNPGSVGFYAVMIPWTSAADVLQSDGSSQYSAYTTTFTTSASTFDIGGWRPPDDNNYKAAWRAYETIVNDHYGRGAWHFVVNKAFFSSSTLGMVTVEVLSPDGGTYFHEDPSTYIHIGSLDYTKALDIVQHEYGHYVMYRAYGNSFPPTDCPSPHYINAISGIECGWTEGWADFFPLMVQSEARRNLGETPDAVFEWGTGAQISLETPTWDTPGWDNGPQVEGRVAGALNDIYDWTNDPVDRYGGYDTFTALYGGIWDTFGNSYDYTFGDFWSVWKSRGHDQSNSGAVACLFHNTVEYAPPFDSWPTISSLSPDKVSPQIVGTTIVWTCSATDRDGDSVLFRFFVQAAGGSWSMVQDWSTANTRAWTPTVAGTYNVACHVRDGKHAGVTGWDDHREFFGYVVKPNSPPVISSLTPDKPSGTQIAGSTTMWTCSATDPDVSDQILYRFFVQAAGAASWSMVRDWSSSNTWSWTPSAAGTYNVACHVRDGKHAGVTGWDDHKEFMGYIVLRGPTVTLSPISGPPGTVVAVAGSGFASGDTTCLISSSPGGLFSSSTCAVSAGIVTGSFTVTTGVASGAYSVAVMGSTGDTGSVLFTATNVPPTISSLSPDKSSPQQVGTSIVWTCSASDLNGDSILYRFFVQPAGGSWSMARDWSTVNAWQWTPTTAGTYNVACHVRDGKHQGASGWDDHKELMGYSVLRGPTVTLSPASGPVGAVVAVTGSGFAVSDLGCTISSTPSGLFSSSTCAASDGVVSGSFTVASGTSGAYTVTVTGAPTGDAGSVLFTVTNGPPTISSLTPDKASGTQVAGSTIIWTCSANDPDVGDSILYRFFVRPAGGSWSIMQDWSASNAWSWTPTSAGSYDIACHVRDGKHAGVSGWDDHKEVYGYVMKPNSPPTVSALSPDKLSPQVVGSTITWTCSASDTEGDTIQYRFWTRLNSGSWSMVQDWSTSNTWAWIPGVAGTWDVACHVRDGKHAGVTGWDDHKEFYGYVVKPNSPPVISGLTPDKASPQLVNTVIVWTCSASDPNGDAIVFRFFVQASGGSWSMVQDWSGTNTLSWTPTIAGTYNIACHVRDGKPGHAGPTGWDDHKEAYGYSIVLGMVSGSSLYGLAAMSVDHSHYFGVSSEMMQPESLLDQRVDRPMQEVQWLGPDSSRLLCEFHSDSAVDPERSIVTSPLLQVP